MTEPRIDPAYAALIQSDRVSQRTRAAVLDRAKPAGSDGVPGVLTAAERVTLGAVLARVLPQAGPDRIDLAARMDAALAAGTGDGWRYANLPPDADACRAGLAAMDDLSHAAGEKDFAAMALDRQDDILAVAASGEAVLQGGWTGEQMQRWFEDLRAEAVKLYVAHPATLARIGYSGLAYGGDGARLPGFVALEPGEREPWEPVASLEPAA